MRSGEPSSEALSTTIVRSGLRVCAASASSARSTTPPPLWLTTTTATLGCSGGIRADANDYDRADAAARWTSGRRAGRCGTAEQDAEPARLIACPEFRPGRCSGRSSCSRSRVRFYWAVRDPAPWIFSDELHYWEPAKAFAYTGAFAIREVPGTGGFGFLYPLLISPAFLLFERLPDAYDAVKAINSLLMSLTVFPVFLLARRVAGRGLALAAAALSVAVPALTYTGNLMVENAFYPLTAFWLLAVVRAFERPTALRQALVVVLIAVAAVTKVQAVTLVPALVTAIVIVVLLDALERGRAGVAAAGIGAGSAPVLADLGAARARRSGCARPAGAPRPAAAGGTRRLQRGDRHASTR